MKRGRTNDGVRGSNERMLCMLQSEIGQARKDFVNIFLFIVKYNRYKVAIL